MAVAFDAQSFLDFTSTNSFTHSPSGTPRGALVLIAQNVVSTDLISAVTYGGVTMTRFQTNVDTVTEPGRTYIYFLGSNIPTGNQTVSVTVSSGTDAKTAWCITATAARNTQVSADSGIDENATNPSVTLGTHSSFQGLVASVFYSGLAAPDDATIAAGSGFTKLTGSAAGGRDFGTSAACAEYQILTGANAVANWTAAADDVAMSAIAIDEVWAGPIQLGQALELN